MTYIKRGQWPIAIIFVILVLFFTPRFINSENYEFLLYIAMMVVLATVIVVTNKKINYSNTTLCGLLIWAGLHMAGGGIYVNGMRLYTIMLITLSETYHIFRFDQFVHIFGFAIATLVVYEVLKPMLKPEHKWFGLSFVVIMAGVGIGAFNEIVEFIATVLVPETGVGGYINTSLDLVSNLIGAVISMIIIYFRESKR